MVFWPRFFSLWNELSWVWCILLPPTGISTCPLIISWSPCLDIRWSTYLLLNCSSPCGSLVLLNHKPWALISVKDGVWCSKGDYGSKMKKPWWWRRAFASVFLDQWCPKKGFQLFFWICENVTDWYHLYLDMARLPKAQGSGMIRFRDCFQGHGWYHRTRTCALYCSLTWNDTLLPLYTAII